MSCCTWVPFLTFVCGITTNLAEYVVYFLSTFKVQQFQRSRKYLVQSQASASCICWYTPPPPQKRKPLIEDPEYFLFVNICSAFADENLKKFLPFRCHGGCRQIGPKNTNLMGEIDLTWFLSSSVTSSICSVVAEKSKMSPQIRGQRGHLYWRLICRHIFGFMQPLHLDFNEAF